MIDKKAALKTRYFGAFTGPGHIGMVRRVAAGNGRFVV